MLTGTHCLNGSNETGFFSEKDPYDIHRTLNYPAFIFERWVTPIIYVLGFPGNLVAFVIWMKPRMRHSSGCYLAALSLANLIFLSLHVVYYLDASWRIRLYYYPGLCQLYPFLSLAFQYLSPVLVLGFTVERYISICHPFKREKLCTTKRATVVVVFMYAGSFFLCSVNLYFWDYRDSKCDLRPSVTEGDARSLWAIWTWVTELLIFLIVPLAVFVFNILVMREARRLSRHSPNVVKDGTSDRKSATTVMLLAVSFYLIGTTLPTAIVYAAVLSFPEGSFELTCPQVFADRTWRAYRTFNFVRTVIKLVGCSHYAFNFYIYLLTGKIFRREAKAFLCGGKLSAALNRKLTYNHMGNSARTGTTTVYRSDKTRHDDTAV